MSLKVLGIVVFISIFMVQGNEAATATCEFGPMDGVEGRQLIKSTYKISHARIFLVKFTKIVYTVN